MKVERWEEESDEDWAERLSEEIESANNTKTNRYFVTYDPYDEESMIINYISENSWTWKEHPEGPFKVTQILEWKKKAEQLKNAEIAIHGLNDEVVEIRDKLDAVKGVIIKYDALPRWEQDMVSYNGLLQEIEDALQSPTQSTKEGKL